MTIRLVDYCNPSKMLKYSSCCDLDCCTTTLQCHHCTRIRFLRVTQFFKNQEWSRLRASYPRRLVLKYLYTPQFCSAVDFTLLEMTDTQQAFRLDGLRWLNRRAVRRASRVRAVHNKHPPHSSPSCHRVEESINSNCLTVCYGTRVIIAIYLPPFHSFIVNKPSRQPCPSSSNTGTQWYTAFVSSFRTTLFSVQVFSYLHRWVHRRDRLRSIDTNWDQPTEANREERPESQMNGAYGNTCVEMRTEIIDQIK